MRTREGKHKEKRDEEIDGVEELNCHTPTSVICLSFPTTLGIINSTLQIRN